MEVDGDTYQNFLNRGTFVPMDVLKDVKRQPQHYCEERVRLLATAVRFNVKEFSMSTAWSEVGDGEGGQASADVETVLQHNSTASYGPARWPSS